MATDKKTKTKAMGSLVNNFRFGIRTNKCDEEFLDYCIGRLAELDHRSKRFVMCDLIREGLTKSEKYSEFKEQLEQEYQGTRAATI